MSPGTIVFDLDGVLYLGNEGVAGAGAALRELAAAGWGLRYATNNSTKTRHTVVAHIKDRTGFDAVPADVVTSAMSAAAYAASSHECVAVVGSDQLRMSLEQAGITVDGSDPSAVVVGLDRTLTYHTIDRAARLIRDGAEFIATNTDSTFPTPNGLAPGAGTVVAAVREASGTPPVDCGKPSERFAHLLEATIDTPNVWMIGDRPETDIALAKAAGWTSILALSGVTSDASSLPESLRPDHVVDSVADLPAIALTALDPPTADNVG